MRDNPIAVAAVVFVAIVAVFAGLLSWRIHDEEKHCTKWELKDVTVQDCVWLIGKTCYRYEQRTETRRLCAARDDE